MRPSLLGVPAMLLAATGCAHLGLGAGEEAQAPKPAAYAPPCPNGAPCGGPSEVKAVSAPTESSGMAGGFAYLERITGGASANETLPMIIALHPRGGASDQFGRIFANFPARARIILPHGAHGGSGGQHYRWWEARAAEDDPQVYADAARPVEAQLAAAITELRANRPTLGRPVVCGFSQGATLAWALAVLHPEHVAAAFTFAGQLPVGFSPGTWRSPWRPQVHVYDGLRDPGNAATRASVGELRRMGIQVELTEYPIGHQLDEAELRDALAQMAAFVSRPGGP